MTFYQFTPILSIAIFTLVFYLHGAYFTSWLTKHKQWPEKFFINVSLGFGIVLLITFFVALFQLLTIVTVIPALLIIPIFHIYNYYKCGIKKFSLNRLLQGIFEHAGLIFIILVFVVPNIYRVFFPDTISDAVRYHLPYAKFYVENHGLAVNEFLRYPLFSHNINLAFSLGYLFQGEFQGEVLARLFISLSFLLIIVGLYSLTAKEFNKTMAIIACIILTEVKSFKIYMVTGYIDIGLSMFVFSCIYFLYLWQKELTKRWLFFAAGMLGIAIGAKYLAFVWLLPITIWVFLTHFKWREASQFFFIAILIGSPWYIRNIIIAGNPIHPFAQDYFGYWLWQPLDLFLQKQDLLIGHGIKRNLWNFIKLPWLLGTDKYFLKSFMGWFLIAGIPFTLFALFMKRFFKFLAVFILINLIFWFFTSQILRYMFAILPMLALFAAYPSGVIIQKLLTNKIGIGVKTKQVFAIFLLIFSCLFIVYKFNNFIIHRPLPKSDIDWRKLKGKLNKSYQFSKILNERRATRVFKVSKAFMQNDFKGEVLGDWFGKANMVTFANQSKSAKDIRIKMKDFNVNYLIVGKKQNFMNRVNTLLKDKAGFEVLLETEEDILYYLKSQ